MKGKPTFIKYVVTIFPLIFLWAGFQFNRENYPNDPEYIYLVNALCICDGQSVGHIDNPGTTLMQIGAATMEVMHLLSNTNKETLIEHVLKKPDLFIEGIRKLIVLMNSLILLLIGWITIKKTGSVWLALLLQTSTFLSVYILDTIWGKLSPEPLLFFVTGIYVIIVLIYYMEENKDQWRYMIFFALIAGAGLGTKATFLPLTIFPLFVLPSFKKKIFYLLGIIPAFVLFTIPAIPEYNSMFIWFKNLISHSGIYGHGQKAIIDPDTYLPNIYSILRNNPAIPVILFSSTLVLCIGYFSGKKKDINWELKFLAGIIMTFIAGILLVAKHYGGNHYLMPVILLTGISLFFIINIINKITRLKIPEAVLLPFIVLLSIAFIAWNHPAKLKISNQQYKNASEEISSVNLWLNQNYSDYTHINYYIYSINKFTGLKFGNDFAKQKMLHHLKEILPNTYFYELATNTFSNWSLKTSLEDIVKKNGNKILLLNSPSNPADIEKIEEQGFPLKKVYEGQAQNIYILDTLRYTLPLKPELKQTESTICFGAEQFTDDKKYFLNSNSELFGAVNALSTKEVRSGTYSIELQKSNSFAVDYNLTNTKKGEIYQIDVWRKSKTSIGYLVVCAENTEEYYIAENEAIDYDKHGWDLLRINIEINEQIAGKKLKIYLWNPWHKKAYFDDLTIKKFEPLQNDFNQHRR